MADRVAALNELLSTAIKRIVAEEGVTERAWEVFDASLWDAREARADSIGRCVLFEDFGSDVPVPEEAK